MMVPLVCRGRLWWALAAGTRRVACRYWGSWAAESKNKPLKQWTLIVHPLSSLRVKLPCNVRVRPQDPLTYPDADRVFVLVSGVDRNVHRGLDLDNIEVRYDEESRQVLITSQDIDPQTCVEVTTPVRFGSQCQHSYKWRQSDVFGDNPWQCRYPCLGSQCDTKLHTTEGNITVDSSDGCLMASSNQGAIDVYVSQAGKVYLKTENGSITLKIPANLQAQLQLTGAAVNVNPDVHLQEIEHTSREGQTILKATLNLVSETQRWIVAEAQRGTVYLKLQDWLQSLKLHTS
ncbi:hypothetical protein GDO81_010076 [Engystomops pustulosus]|uniref:Adhesin domain-containing protein n=1 Tax=Engystomops pustulosus TaxID=76066 RepID=A0AAV7BWK7_ENGPU|nr:hypothetical protein GDO81_010076 [Engystomops pustulosus]